MAKRQTVTMEELVRSLLYQQEELVRILERKGITSKQEVLDELKVMKKEDEDLARGN